MSAPLESRPLADQLRQFNDERRKMYGRGPHPDNRLPIPRSGVGADIDPPEDWQK